LFFEASVILGERPSERKQQGDPATAVNSDSPTVFLGAGLSNLNHNLTEENRDLGVRIDSVSPGGPAWRAQLQEADIIVEVDGSPTVSTEDIMKALQGKSPGNTLAVVIRRNPYRNVKVQLSYAIGALSILQLAQGRYEQALETLQRSIAIDRSLMNDHPNDTGLLLNYTAGLVNLPVMQRSVGRLADAAATYEELWRLYESESLKIAEPLGWIRSDEPHPDGIRVLRVQRDSAAAESSLQAKDVVLEVNDESVNLGLTRNDFGGMPGEKIALLVKRDTETMTLTITVRPAPTKELAAVARNLGVLHKSYLVDLKLAKTWFIRSLEIARRRRALISFYTPEEKEEHQFYSDLLAGVLVELGNVSYRMAMAKGGTGDLSDTISTLEEAVEIELGLVESNPAVLKYQSMLAIASGNLASVYSANGSVDKAVSLFKKSVMAFEALVRLNPSEPRLRINLAALNRNIGDALVKITARMEHYDKAMDIYDALISEGVEQRRVHSIRGELHCEIAWMNWGEGQHQVAIVHYRAAAQDIASSITEPMSVLDSKNVRLIEIWGSLALLQAELGDESAVAKIRAQIASVRLRRIGKLQELLAANALDKEIRIDLAIELNDLANGQASTTPADIEQQRVWHHDLLKLFGDKPDVDALDDLEADLVSRGYGNLGWCDILLKKPESAILNCRVALEYSPDANWIVQNLALAHLYNGQFQKSLSIYAILLAGAEDKNRFRQDVKSEFENLRGRGLDHSDINKLLKELE
jgi:tetratricopeptide (TPR) repeat protein